MVRQKNKGFTLVEVAIVLLIAGLLVGGILKGSELILSARVRHLIADMDGAQTAYLAFQDRFRARPGDYSKADTNILCGTACPIGNGDGLIKEDGPVVGTSELHEDILVWTHLAASGFIQGGYRMAAGETIQKPDNSPRNSWGSLMHLGHDKRWGAGAAERHNVKSGDFVPVEVLAEADRKIDDGRPFSGHFQFTQVPAPTDPLNLTLVGCTVTSGADVLWGVLAGAGNCAAAIVLE